MTLANYGIGFNKHKDTNFTKVLSKCLQIRNRAELAFKQCLKNRYKTTPEKRNEFIQSIAEYYSRLPFNVVIWNKYQTKQCINDSIFLNPDFNPYKAKEAFRLVEEMLINLVWLPWHQEFKKIHTYSGHYRLFVSGPLIGIEEVFKAAGFQESFDCPLHLLIPEDKMPQVDEGECVTSVIFDCMIAQVVCSDIIDVFENVCRTSKLHINDYCDYISRYQWIQRYFRERVDQTSDRACHSIQDLLNDLANHLMRPDTKTLQIKSQPVDYLGETSNKNSEFAQRSSSKESLKSNTQLRTREFLASQMLENNSIPNELLRIPSSKVDIYNRRRLPEVNQFNAPRSSNIRPSIQEIHNHSYNQPPMLNNGFDTNQYQKQSSYDFTDCLTRHNTNSHRNNSESLSTPCHHHLVEIDTPHSDREPLIPKYDRRPASLHHSSIHNYKKGNIYDDGFNNHSTIKSNGVSHFGQMISSSREHFRDNHIDFDRHHHQPSSHSQISSENHNRLNLSKYSNPLQRKYESRDLPNDTNILANNRTYWSCGSCTYNNLFSSEICEMCRGRRPSRSRDL